MRTIIQRAKELAQLAHAGQVKKHSGEPYFNHCEQVAGIIRDHNGSEEEIAAAYLHDVVEDTHITFQDIEDEFGRDIAQLVREVTNVSLPSDGNRQLRKEKERQHLAKASESGKNIKLADIIANFSDTSACTKEFLKVYSEEKKAVLEVLKDDSNQKLWKKAYELVHSVEFLAHIKHWRGI